MSIILFTILLGVDKFETTHNDLNIDEQFPVDIEMAELKKCTELSAVEISSSNDHVKLKTIYDYESEVGGKQWNAFNGLFLLVSIICILIMFMCIGCCASLCDRYENEN